MEWEMLSDRHCQLLTAYVDGVLSARRRKVVLKLLRKLPEAREILKELEEHAEKLRRLPAVKLEPEFASRVVEAIQARPAEIVADPVSDTVPLEPISPRRAPVPWLPAWARISAAAAVLGFITFGSYLFFSNLLHRPTDDMAGDSTPADPKKQSPLLAGPRKALRIAGGDLGQEKTKTLLAKELRKDDNAVHVSIAVRDTNQAGKRLVDALSARNIKVVIDGQAKARLQSDDPNTAFVVYAENLRPEDVGVILRQFGKASPASSVQAVQVGALDKSHRAELSRLLGVNLPAPPLETFNPIGATSDMDGKNGKETEPGSVAPPPPPAEPLALVMALDSGAAASSRSPQIKQFLDRRKAFRPGSVQLVLVVHQASA
jgi:anti-sigma factor RsiW